MNKDHDHDPPPAIYVAVIVLPAPIDLVLPPSLLAAVFIRTETLLERYHQCLPSEPDVDIQKAHSQGYLEIPTFSPTKDGLNKRNRHLPVPRKNHQDFFYKRKLTIFLDDWVLCNTIEGLIRILMVPVVAFHYNNTLWVSLKLPTNMAVSVN